MKNATPMPILIQGNEDWTQMGSGARSMTGAT